MTIIISIIVMIIIDINMAKMILIKPCTGLQQEKPLPRHSRANQFSSCNSYLIIFFLMVMITMVLMMMMMITMIKMVMMIMTTYDKHCKLLGLQGNAQTLPTA